MFLTASTGLAATAAAAFAAAADVTETFMAAFLKPDFDGRVGEVPPPVVHRTRLRALADWKVIFLGVLLRRLLDQLADEGWIGCRDPVSQQHEFRAVPL